MGRKKEETKKTGLKHKYAVKMLGHIPDTILPDGWIGVNHVSGAVVYLHRETRVVTWSRPYTISRATSLKKHNIPLMSIPCLHQKLALDDEFLGKKEGKRTCPIDHEPSAKVRKLDENFSENNIGEDETSVDMKIDGNTTNLPYSKCNGTVHSETVENISTCPYMESVSDSSEQNTMDTTNNTCDESLTVNVANTANSLSENVSASKSPCINKLETMPNMDCEVSASTETTENTLNIISQEICNKNEETQDSVNTTSSNAVKVSQKMEITCPYKITEPHKLSNSISTPNSNDCVASVVITPSYTDRMCLSPITDCSTPSPTTEGPRIDFSTFNCNGVEETKSSSPPSDGVSVSTENDPPNDGSDDFVETAGPDEIAPTNMHIYLNKLFEFDLLTGDQGNVPIFSENIEQPEVIEDINIDKKFITDGKTPFQILNEYCQRELKALPAVSKIERHSQHDFTVEIIIKNYKYGISTGDTLREAKHNAAASTLNIFDYTILNEDEPSGYLTVFDKIPVDDKAVLSTVEEFSAMGVKYPYDILVHLLKRNFSPTFAESHIEFKTENIDDSKQKYNMKYKESEVTGECETWRQVKQIASQALIQILYPDLKNWGSFIRLMEAYTELVTSRELETESKLLKPGKCIMHVLRQEMRKIAGNLSI